MKRILWLTVGVMLMLAACGGEEQAGVELEAAGQSRPSTATPTPPPAETDEAEKLSGRLLLLKGQHYEILDLSTNETTVLDDLPTFSSLQLNADRTRGAFVAFPDFGLLDLTTSDMRTIENTGSNPVGVSISPDGRWMLTITGQLRIQMQLVPLDGPGDPLLVASGSNTFFLSAWLDDSRLLWWEIGNPAGRMIFDPTTGESTPVGDSALALTNFPFSAVSPDSARLAVIPLLFGAQASIGLFDTEATSDSQSPCLGSEVQLYDLPVQFGVAEAQVIWTENELVASSPTWLDNDTLLFIRVGYGVCGQVEGDPVREIMMLDVDAPQPQPEVIAGPLGNANDPNDEEQNFGGQLGHLYSPSPDGQYVAWIGGGNREGESSLNITDIDTGETQALLTINENEALGAADFIEHYMLRQVLWLE